MHELSLASSILGIARRSVPPGARLRVVRVVAGPMRAIDSDAMQFAWQSVAVDAGLERVVVRDRRFEMDRGSSERNHMECSRKKASIQGARVGQS